MIHVCELAKSYADVRGRHSAALAGVSFVARPGEIFGLLGPNGAGKTTLLRILSTILKPTSGTATVDGHDVATEADRVRRKIGFVSTNTALYDRMTAWEIVEYFGRLHGMAPCLLRDRLESIFHRFSMTEIRDLPAGKMSTGMKQKVSIARAIVHDPPVLIFDEATSGLDVLAARAVLDTVAQLQSEGKCIIFSTHIMREAERLCDQIAVIHRGRILATGSLNELREEYAEPDLEELFFRLISNSESHSPHVLVQH